MTDAGGNYMAQERIGYDGFGNQTYRTGESTRPGDFQFAGRWGYQTEYAFGTEPGVGLQYLEQRYYDPVVGRFLTPDPIGFAGGLNLYSYVDNDPVNAVDPLGLVKVWVSVTNIKITGNQGHHIRLILIGNQPGDTGKMFYVEAHNTRFSPTKLDVWGPIRPEIGPYAPGTTENVVGGFELQTSPWVSGMSLSAARGRMGRVCDAIRGAYGGMGFPYAPAPIKGSQKDGRIIGNSGSAARAFLERGLGLKGYLSEQGFLDRSGGKWRAFGYDQVLFPGKQ